MGCIGLILAVLGVFGYANQIWWLFYLVGGIVAFFDVIALISGELRCLGTIVTLVFWYSAYRLTGSVVDGIILGSSASTVFMVVITFVFMAFTAGIGAAFSGLISIFDRLKNLNK